MATETINDLYLKYANKVGKTLESDRYFQYLFEMVQAGDNLLEQKYQVMHKVVDEAWLTIIEDTLDDINDIIDKPRRFIATKEEVVPVALARKITADSVRHLSMNTQFIASSENGDIQPTRVLNVSTEESYDLYENRFVYHLIQRLVTFIDKRTDVIFWSTGDETQNALSFQSKVDDAYEEISYKIEMVIKNRQSFAENDSDNMNLFMRIDRVRRMVMALKNSSFCDIMAGCSKVRSPIQRTNLIMKDPHYRACYKLWQFLEQYDDVGYTIEVQDTALEFDEEYLFQMYTNLITNYTVFKSLLETDKRDLMEVLNKKRRVIKPKFVKKIKEVIVDDYNLEDVEIRRVIIEEVTQAQLDAEAKLAEETERRQQAEQTLEDMDVQMIDLQQQISNLMMMNQEAEIRTEQERQEKEAAQQELTQEKEERAAEQEKNRAELEQAQTEAADAKALAEQTRQEAQAQIAETENNANAQIAKTKQEAQAQIAETENNANAQIAKTKQEAQAQITEARNAANAEVAKTKQEAQAQIESVEKQHQEQLDALREEMNKAVAEAERRTQEAIQKAETTEQDAQRNIARMQQQTKEIVAEIQQKADTQIDSLQKENGALKQESVSLKQEKASLMEQSRQLERDLEKQIRQTKSELEDARKKAKADAETAERKLKESTDRAQQELAQEKQRAQSELQAARKHSEEELMQEKQRSQGELQAVRKHSEEELMQEKKRSQNELQAAKQQAQEQLASAQAQTEAVRKELADVRTELQNTKQSARAQLEEEKKQSASREAQLQREMKAREEQAKEDTSRKLTELKREHEKELGRIQEQAQDTLQRMEKDKEALKKSLDEAYVSREEREEQIAALEGELATAREKARKAQEKADANTLSKYIITALENRKHRGQNDNGRNGDNE